AIFRPGIIAGNAHTPRYAAWLGRLIPGPFGTIEQDDIGRAPLSLNSSAARPQTGSLLRDINTQIPDGSVNADRFEGIGGRSPVVPEGRPVISSGRAQFIIHVRLRTCFFLHLFVV